MPISPSGEPSVIAVTLGDPGGIGPEVTVKALALFSKTPEFRRTCLVWIGIPGLYRDLENAARLKTSFEVISTLDPANLRPSRVYVLDLPSAFSSVTVRGVGKEPLRVFPDSYDTGVISSRNAFLAYASLQIAAHLACCRKVGALATAPINKEAMRLLDPSFIGHTEYLAQVSRTKSYAMLFDGGDLKVALATIHVPLDRVKELITKERIAEKIGLCHTFLKTRYGIAKPRIAVCALNPHGREFGRTEEEEIEPAVLKMKRRGISVSGPYPGDTVFRDALRGRHDLVLAMYHDQGLAPLKTIAFDRAVNITAGLPFVRTSPDHGTAFDIAGKNKADAQSMYHSILLAARLLFRKSK
ncbi:MAG TPA: 4-hydroxythreonine-4-phosphate dehydrogenase PdxA [Candidatus Omnitrophota bacterium]|nr:4-hydroxythreonine-4-phosphate dehydrogenase PdxA [Candidatus Omnitrophota bacterium]